MFGKVEGRETEQRARRRIRWALPGSCHTVIILGSETHP